MALCAVPYRLSFRN